MPLRFPNPGSDIARLVNTYRLIHAAAAAQQPFDLDFMSTVLVENGQASSSGAIGGEALARSYNADRSRDRLYNQSKMYSEVFRMLGLLRPTAKRLEFSTTYLGDALADGPYQLDALSKGLFIECLLGIVFPNPLTQNIGVANQRPFRLLLLLTHAVGGVITRHEMILGVLAVTDDRADGAIDNAVDTIQRVRGRSARLFAAVDKVAGGAKVARNTLENYTRFPVGVLKSPLLGLGAGGRVPGLYERPAEAISLTAAGVQLATDLVDMADVRAVDLEPFALDECAHFANVAYYAMLERAGHDLRHYDTERRNAWAGSRSIRRALSIKKPAQVLYSPFQQATDDVIARAQAMGD
jgi:hypothetical protein